MGVVQLPRYVRVNLLKTTTAKVIKRFRKEGYVHIEPSQVNCKLCQLSSNQSDEDIRVCTADCSHSISAAKGYSKVEGPLPLAGCKRASANARQSGNSASNMETRIPERGSQGSSHRSLRKDSRQSVFHEADKQWFSVDQHVPDLLVFPPM